VKETHILLIDNSVSHVESFYKKLTSLGYNISPVIDNADEILSSIVRIMPELIIMNPEMNIHIENVSLAEYVRREYEIPIVFISDSANDAHLNDALKANVDGYLYKSSAVEEINATILVALKNSQQKKNQKQKIKEINSKATHLAEVNIRMALLVDAYQRIRNAENSLYADQNMQVFYNTILSDLAALTGSAYGALVLMEGNKVSEFFTTGIAEDVMNKIGSFPIGKGVLHDIYADKRVKRINDVSLSEKSLGFPEGHPMMKTLMGVSLWVNKARQGAIYLAQKKDDELYTDKDEMLFRMFVVELEHVLERNFLVNSLRNERLALKVEKVTQKHLITRLDEMQEQLTQSDKMASIGQLAAGVAHEINNPIGYVSSNLTTLQKYVSNLIEMIDVYEKIEGFVSDKEHLLLELESCKKKVDLEYTKTDVIELLNESHEGISRVKKIVQDLKDFSHVDEAEWQWADINAGITSTLNIVNNELKYKAELVKDLGMLPEIECIASQLNQVFMNLLVNAAHAIDERGRISIVTRQKDNDWITVEVTDTGCGIEEKNIKNIFNPFFTTKPVGKGTGLGLSLTYSIIQKHHGHIEVKSKPGEGTTFTILLPVKQPVENNGEDGIPDDNINMAV